MKDLLRTGDLSEVDMYLLFAYIKQAKTDMFTLSEKFGGLRGKRLAFVGAGNNVVHSLLEATAVVGMDFPVATPPRYEPVVQAVLRSLHACGLRGRDVAP